MKSGFITVIGRPNVGKSTLLNSLLGKKVVIVSDKPQTTRNKIQCILTTEMGQAIFIDTPGIHKPHHRLGEVMVKTAQSTFNEVDIVFYVVEPGPIGPGDERILTLLQRVRTPVYLVVNKIDTCAPERVSETAASYSARGNFNRQFYVSALTGENLQQLLTATFTDLPEGPLYYPAEMEVDHPEEFLIAEFIREKVLLLTREEVPHSVAVEIESIKEREGKDLIDVHAAIHVERDSQKGIIIGRGGRMLKEIGQKARDDIQGLLGSQVNLQLWVRVSNDWRNKESKLHSLGYRVE